MRGVVFVGERELEIREFPDPTPGPGEVIVAIKASGMCGSDLHSYREPKSVRTPDKHCIAGHEPCGVVAARGPGVREAAAPIGQRVMIHHYRYCGQCRHCRSGWSQMCLQDPVTYGVNGDGGHAQYMRVQPEMLVPLPDELSFEEGAAASCGTGTAFQGLRRLDVSGRDTLVIFGQGPVGLSGTLLAKAMGARVVAVDITPERLELAERFGADVVLNPRQVDVTSTIKELTYGEGADAALETSGSVQARNDAVGGARIWGRVCFIGIGGAPTTFNLERDVIHKQLNVFGSWTFSSVIQADCARFVVDNKLPLGAIFTDRFRLDQAADAYRLFDTQTTGKGVFIFD
jgi:threonine dehydrogenase-like Zn-dependent dehydrogenase